MPLEGIIDVEEEKKRLSKSLDKLQKEISALKGRLQNSKFIESAPEEVILETQENLVLREEKRPSCHLRLHNCKILNMTPEFAKLYSIFLPSGPDISNPRWRATVKMSLSPLPHIFMQIMWFDGRSGAIFITWLGHDLAPKRV